MASRPAGSQMEEPHVVAATGRVDYGHAPRREAVPPARLSSLWVSAVETRWRRGSATPVVGKGAQWQEQTSTGDRSVRYYRHEPAFFAYQTGDSAR